MKQLSEELKSLLYGTGRTLATAESCTGGGIAAAIVQASGSSGYFKGGIVSYCNEIKERLLGVPHDVLEEKTAVCEEVAYYMCEGAMRALSTDYAIAITGIAGPGGGTDTIPVGTIWIAYGSHGNVNTYRLSTDNGREENLKNATKAALELLVKFLKK